MQGILTSRVKKEIVVGNLDILQNNTQIIILEIKNRLELLCRMTNTSKRKISIILGKTEGYVAHRFSYNEKLNLTVFIEIIKTFGIPLDKFFISKKEDFLLYINDCEIERLKSYIKKSYESVEQSYLEKEINFIIKKLKKTVNRDDKISLLRKLIKKTKKYKSVLEIKKTDNPNFEQLKKLEKKLVKANNNITQAKLSYEDLLNNNHY